MRSPAKAQDETRPIQVPELARLRDDWETWRGSAALPQRSALNPLALTYCLPNLALVDIEREPFRPRYRLVGTRLVDLWGRELRGRYVDEVYRFPVRSEVLAAYRKVVTTGEPLYNERLFNLGFRRLGYQRLMLPLTAGGDSVDQVVLAIYPSDRRIRVRADWKDLAE
ncbi:PAS domain-containing protein [Tistlia consotensis]|uniref:PAS domain-containing protein n=1 Tax=Tistlia consotensis USBA 355 TaxID=560819 RepID=A0A1Y6BKS9_9PROT|nr:PAS domain-containing protein [Tistlia consotensis]SMF16421.1 PAS domain-containing protein [Tistlia consotensis USBA 355]SNR41161.1 PAS domain-containing protein [Tistlia consotensis]